MVMLLSYIVTKIIFWELFGFYHLFTQAGTVCVHAVKLVDGNISNECIKWNQNQEVKSPYLPPVFFALRKFRVGIALTCILKAINQQGVKL